MKRKLKIAITGNIGSGKSTFAKFISGIGYPVILADDLSKEILATDPQVKAEIIKEFGAQAFLGSEINKKYLAEKVFANKTKLKKINSILHPKVRVHIESLAKEYFKVYDIVFVEAALIFESKIQNMFDYVVLITAEKSTRMNRTKKQRRLSSEEFIERESNQLPEDVKKTKADFIFSNDGSKEDLRRKADLLINLVKSIQN